MRNRTEWSEGHHFIENSFKDFQVRLVSHSQDDEAYIKEKIYGFRARLIPLTN